MAVSELIKLQAEYPADMRVVVNGYEEGYDDLSREQLTLVKISLNTGARDYVGTHGDVDYVAQERMSGLEIEEALVLRRESFS